MRIDTGQHMRMSQQMKLAARMIQSMEILQMPWMALEQRIAEELTNNPTLELREDSADPEEIAAELKQEQRDASEGEREMVVSDDKAGKSSSDDFERLTNLSEEYGESWADNAYETSEFRPARDDGERDKKMDAMANTAARQDSLAEQLLDQWHLVDAPPNIIKAGEFLINFIDDEGYLRTPLEELKQQAPGGVAQAELEQALRLLHESLEPPGMAARDLRECLLIQIDLKVLHLKQESQLLQKKLAGPDPSDNGHDQPDEAKVDPEAVSQRIKALEIQLEELTVQRLLVSDFLKDIEGNRLPRIAKESGLDIEKIKQGILNLRQFTPLPGRTLVDVAPQHITPDTIVEYDEEQDQWVARLTNGRLPGLQINSQYAKMAKDHSVDRKTREFVGNNLRSARWLIDAIQQRNHTLARVLAVVLEAQREYFTQGPQALKPLPMTQVADQLGIHVATVSRAVNQKYVQTPHGTVPLRMFFSGGTETESGESMSWAAVQAKLQQIINEEDKAKPLSDDELVEKLKAQGIEIARRTVAKYRKEMNIAPARQRVQY